MYVMEGKTKTSVANFYFCRRTVTVLRYRQVQFLAAAPTTARVVLLGRR